MRVGRAGKGRGRRVGKLGSGGGVGEQRRRRRCILKRHGGIAGGVTADLLKGIHADYVDIVCTCYVNNGWWPRFGCRLSQRIV